MGKAKRRKRLNPHWGKSKPNQRIGAPQPEKTVEQLRDELLGWLKPDNPDDLPQIRTIREELNQKGGFQLMYRVADSLPKQYQRTVDVTWHGIGEWRA